MVEYYLVNCGGWQLGEAVVGCVYERKSSKVHGKYISLKLRDLQDFALK